MLVYRTALSLIKQRRVFKNTTPYSNSFHRSTFRFCSFKADSVVETTNVNQSHEHNEERTKNLVDDAATFKQEDLPGDEWCTPVYPVNTDLRRPPKPKKDPNSRAVLLFPGQGVQYVGMSKSLLEFENVKEMFQCASEIMRFNLLELCLNGPKQMLDDTQNCQVAIMVASLAAVEKLKTIAPNMIETCAGAAGFSVGEYAALVFSGALVFEDAVRLLKIRGEAMQAASELCPSGMMTVVGTYETRLKYTCTAAQEWCVRQGIKNPECSIASYLFPECKVIAGHMEALKFIKQNAANFGIKKLKFLRVSGAFHSKLMKPAMKVMEKALNTVPVELPLIHVFSNVDARPYKSVERIRKDLAKQICSPVKWEQIMHTMFERPQGTPFPNTYECGPGRTMLTILKQNNSRAFLNSENIEA